MGLNDYQGYNHIIKENLIMKVPVYGFEQNYEIDENGVLYSKKNNFAPLRTAPQASARQNRYRLANKKYYDAKYLVFKSFNPSINVEVNDDKIFFIDGDTRNCNINNLKILDNNNNQEVALMLSEKYQEKICPIPNYKNYYISENGNVYSFYHSCSKLLKPYLGTDGYLQIKIPDNYGTATHVKLHRMVGLLFVKNPNPDKYDIVHHKDENKQNNNFMNLEWTTLTQNTICSSGKQCCMLDKNNCILSVHSCIADLARCYNVDSSTASKQCRGQKNCFANGFKARLFDSSEHNFVPTKFD